MMGSIVTRIVYNALKWVEPTLYGSGSLRPFLLERSEVAHQKYCPPLICYHPALQFILRKRFEKPPPQFDITKGTLQLSDGGIVALDQIYLPGVPSEDDNNLCVIVPGGRETTHSITVQSIANSLLKSGFSHTFVLNARASCSIPLRSKNATVPFGSHNHIAECISHLESLFPEKKILLFGACFGSGLVVDYLSNENHPNVVGAVLHSSNWKSQIETTEIKSGLNYHLFLKLLVKDTVKRIFRFADQPEKELKREWYEEQGIDVEQVKAAKTVWDIDEHFIAPLLNLSSADDYYRRISPVYKCHRIRKPVVLINSRDDSTIASLEEMDLPGFMSNPNLVLWSTAAGGHVSFLESVFPVTSYLNRVVPEVAHLICEYAEEQEEAKNRV